MFSGRVGGGYKFSKLNVGGYFEPAGKLLSNRRIRNNSSISTAGTVTDKSETNKSTQATRMQWGLGCEYRLDADTKAVIDYAILESEHFNNGANYEESARMRRLGFGVSRVINLQTQLLFGYQLTSYAGYLDQRETESYYANIGIERKISYLQSLLNLFYSEFQGEGSQSNLKNIGISVGTSYSY